MQRDPAFQGIRGTDPARARENLPGDKERDQIIQSLKVEGKVPGNQIVFVGPEGGISSVIDVVFDERDLLAQTQLFQRLLN